MPYFTLPAGIDKLLTPIALAHWISEDGGFDGHGRGEGRLTLFTNRHKILFLFTNRYKRDSS